MFDFLGKDSIRYYNAVPVDKQVFKNLGLFMRDKQPGDDLFDRLNVSTSLTSTGILYNSLSSGIAIRLLTKVLCNLTRLLCKAYK